MHIKARDKLFERYPLQAKKGVNVGYQKKKKKWKSSVMKKIIGKNIKNHN